MAFTWRVLRRTMADKPLFSEGHARRVKSGKEVAFRGKPRGNSAASALENAAKLAHSPPTPPSASGDASRLAARRAAQADADEELPESLVGVAQRLADGRLVPAVALELRADQ